MSQHPPAAIVVAQTKSVGIALLLSFLFGPIGMLYSTVIGALVMFIANVVALLLTAGLGLLLTWPIGMAWAAVAVNGSSSKLLTRSE
jgi:hypothetical protein